MKKTPSTQNILVIFEPFNARGRDGKRAPNIDAALANITTDSFKENGNIIVETLAQKQCNPKIIAQLQKDHRVSPDHSFVVTSNIGNVAKAVEAGANAIGVSWRGSTISNGISKNGFLVHGAVCVMTDFADFADALSDQIARKITSKPTYKTPRMMAARKLKK